jgi:putative ABC transport system substrate-binding protein
LRQAAAQGAEIDAIHFLTLVEAGEDDGPGAGHRVTAALQTLRAAELVGLSPDLILASTTPAAAALRQQSRTIPIVLVQLPDPVGQGLVQSLARPGGNITGFSSFDAALMGKWLQLLKDVAPSVTRVSVIFSATQAASYIDGILKGASPANLPVQYPTKFSPIINLKTAKALGLTLPTRIPELADEVIE